MTNPTFPLSTPDKPVAIKTESMGDAFVYAEFDGYLFGRCGTRAIEWDAALGVAIGFADAYNLIPPEPERRYGVAKWVKSTGELVHFWVSQDTFEEEGYEIVRQPIARPGEKLCVVPSREKLVEAIKAALDKRPVYVNEAVDNVIALFEDM